MIGIVLANRYEILEQIGEGGMATVYRAIDLVLKRHVAIKILKQQFNSDKEFIVNFGNEAQSAASLNHPNIVNIFDVGSEEVSGQTYYYIVMECIEGFTLKDLIDEEAPLSDDRIVSISSQIAQALRAAHANRIIHRDIKPQNIMISEDDDIKVTDFGIAKISTSSTITYTSSILGTVHYISPEQAKGKFIDEKSDLYSLGIVMYEMATGNVPFDGENAVAIAIRHIQDPLIPPIDLNPSLSPGLNQIIVKTLQKDTSLRYANATELLNDLKKYKSLQIRSEQSLDQTTILKPVEVEAVRPEPVPVPEPITQKSVYQAKQSPGQDVSDEKKDPFKRVVLPILLALIFVGAGFFFIRGFLMNNRPTESDVTESSSVVVENFLGLTLAQAERSAEKLGIVLTTNGESFSNDYAAGEIMEQSIQQGETVARGAEIKVILSKGQEMVRVPSLLNNSPQDAESALNRVNLVIGEQKTDSSDSYNEGMVMKQNPAAHSEVPVGTAVSITVSSGKKVELISMPDLRNERQYDAIRTLNDLDLKVGNVRTEHDETVAEDHVISQSVTHLTKVEPQTTIDLVVSIGPKTEPATEPPATEPVTEPQTEPAVPDVEYLIQVTPPTPQPDGQTTYQVHIVRIDGELEEDLSNRTFNYADGTQTIRLTDSPGIKFDLYINGTFIKSVTQ